MGLVYADIELFNADYVGTAAHGFIKPEAVLSDRQRTLVDSGAYMLGSNERIAEKHNLRKHCRCTADAVMLRTNTQVLLGCKIWMSSLTRSDKHSRSRSTLSCRKVYPVTCLAPNTCNEG